MPPIDAVAAVTAPLAPGATEPGVQPDVLAGSDLVDAHRALRDRLIAAGRLVPTGVDGLYGKDAVYEAVLRAIDAKVHAIAEPDAPSEVEYPPIIPTATFDRIGYLRNFPQLVGPVFSFDGDQADHRHVVDRLDAGDDYADLLTQAEVAMTPACCYSVYPSVAGALPSGGATFETMGYCFRHEPSVDPMRLQSFRQREHIRVATPDEVVEWRARWLERAPQLIADLGLDVVSDVANDPFFGRAGRLMARSQRELQLKIEFLVDVYGAGNRTACSSINHHRDHFAHMFGISADGEDAHSSCIGFGLERLTVAMFARFGTDPAAWSPLVRAHLGL